jgi:hypothetical protein
MKSTAIVNPGQNIQSFFLEEYESMLDNPQLANSRPVISCRTITAQGNACGPLRMPLAGAIRCQSITIPEQLTKPEITLEITSPRTKCLSRFWVRVRFCQMPEFPST